jgi:hypothetical protein
MSNLGGYRNATMVMKALGGPKAAVAIIGSGLLILGGGLYAGVEVLVKTVGPKLRKRAVPCPHRGQFFIVAADGDSGDGLSLRAGENYRLIECDGDAVIVEVIGRDDNPHAVSGAFLSTISGYPSAGQSDVA